MHLEICDKIVRPRVGPSSFNSLLIAGVAVVVGVGIVADVNIDKLDVDVALDEAKARVLLFDLLFFFLVDVVVVVVVVVLAADQGAVAAVIVFKPSLISFATSSASKTLNESSRIKYSFPFSTRNDK